MSLAESGDGRQGAPTKTARAEMKTPTPRGGRPGSGTSSVMEVSGQEQLLAKSDAPNANIPASLHSSTGAVVNMMPVLDQDAVAEQVHDVIRNFHSSVASPLASIGLQLEVLRLDSNTPASISAQLGTINSSLDGVISVIRDANRALRGIERHIRSERPSTTPD